MSASLPSFDLIVIGEGVAGLACARRAAQLGLGCATFESYAFGGLVLNVNDLEPSPAGGPARGAEFASTLVEANAELGVPSHQAAVTAIQQTGSGFVVTADGERYSARHVVVASGASRALLGVEGEVRLAGRGVSLCADCDGPLYQGQDVVVVGGGDSALQEALVLARYCRTVYLVHRRGHFRAAPSYVARIAATPAIRVLPDCTIVRIDGNDSVTGVTLRDAGTGVERALACGGVFAYVGLVPNTSFLMAGVACNAHGRIITDAAFCATLPGLYAVGAVRAGDDGTLAGAIRDAEELATHLAAHRTTAD